MIHSNISSLQSAIGTFTRSEDTVTVRVANVPIYNGEPLTTVGGLSYKHLEPDCSNQERYFTPLTVSALPLGATGAV